VIFPAGLERWTNSLKFDADSDQKPRKTMPFILFGAEFWNEIINFDALLKWE